LIENGERHKFESLTPNPIRRDKPAQRFRHNGFSTTVSKRAFYNSENILQPHFGFKFLKSHFVNYFSNSS
jgi:hypothetical protein